MEHAYENFSAANFLTDDAFVNHQLEPTPQSTQFWHSWLDQHPHRLKEHQQAIDLVAAIRLGLTDYAQTHIPEQTMLQLLSRIQQTNAQVRVTKSSAYAWGWMRWAAAAVVLLTMGVGIWWQTKPHTSLYEQQLGKLQAYTFIEKINSTQHVQTIHLPDRSVVSLAPESRISYPTSFGQQNRTVYLSGEATFSVTRNSGKPFLVHANEVVTKVVGTQFTVRAFAKETQVQVQVQSGQVSVYRNEQTGKSARQKGVMLLPNQQVVFDRETDQFDKRLIESPSLIPSSSHQRKAPSFVYNDTPIPQVLQDLKEAYGIDIRYNKEALANCQLNSSMTNESFEQKLTIVCATVGATYEIIDGQVIINGGNCQLQ